MGEKLGKVTVFLIGSFQPIEFIKRIVWLARNETNVSIHSEKQERASQYPVPRGNDNDKD